MEGQEENVKVEKIRETICSVDDPLKSGIDIVVYTDNTVDVDIHGNKAGILVSLIWNLKNNPEEMEDIEDKLNKVAEINLFISKHHVTPDKYETVIGTIDDVYDTVRKCEDSRRRKNGFISCIDQIPNQDDLLKLLSRLQKDDFEFREEVIAHGTEKLRELMKSGN